MKNHTVSSREFVKLSAAAAAGLTVLPGYRFGLDQLPAPMKRTFGKTGFEVTTLGLGGQASLQWTPADVDPVPIILKAFKMGVNYFDTSRVYGDSEKIFGEIIKKRDRSKLVIATKSGMRRKADILKNIDESLTALGTDYVDIYHLHARDTPTAIPDDPLTRSAGNLAGSTAGSVRDSS